MYFTQDDYRRIEEWLRTRTVKDTQFPKADPLTGFEEVPIIQDGKNKVVDLDTFIRQLSLMELPDFLNVTTFTKRGHLSLEEAVNSIPVEQRKLGLTITYYSEKGNWMIYQFKGTSLNQWDSLNYWSSIVEEAIAEFVYHPDEEDITGVRDGNRTFLKFKDKDYDPAEFSGMGRIMLRKNLVGTEACAIDDEDHLNNVLTQDMIREENTVYIVQYDFDLDGKVISIPKGCTLWFQGGSINNGTIYLQETAILGAFEFADMGNAKLFGKFNTGQIMTFSNDSYKAKEGGYFIPSTKPSSATPQEDAKQDRETFYDKNPNAYTTETRQELRWWNGEEWILILDITDYNELKSIINDLIEKHNAEMSACYKYFKARCYALELRMDDAERRLDEHDTILENHETRITKVEGDIENINQEITNIHNDITNIEGDISNLEQNVTNITNDINNITQNISDITDIINNLDQTIENHIRQFIETNVVGVASVTVNGTKYEPDSNGNITLPDYPEAGGGTADRTKGTLRFTGASSASYDGSSDVTVNIPEGGSGGGQADSVKGTLTVKTAAGDTLGTYNGSEDKTITIPASGGGGGDTYITAKEPLTLTQGSKVLGVYDGTDPKTIDISATGEGGGTADKVSHKLKFTGAVTAEYDGSEEVTVNIPAGGGGGPSTPNQPLIFKGAVNETYDGSVQKEVTIPEPVTIAELETKTLTLQDQKGNTKTAYNAKEDKTVKSGSILFRTNDGDKLHDALDGIETQIDLRPFLNGGNGHPVVLYSAELTRSKSSTNWREAYSQKHEGLGSVSFTTSDCMLSVNLSPRSGWSINIATAVANARDINGLSYNSSSGPRSRANGCWMQCGTNSSSTVYLHSWRTDNANNDAVSADCLHRNGRCLGISIVVIGYITKNS